MAAVRRLLAASVRRGAVCRHVVVSRAAWSAGARRQVHVAAGAVRADSDGRGDGNLFDGVGGSGAGLFGDDGDDAAGAAEKQEVDVEEWLQQAEGLDEEAKAAVRAGKMPPNMLYKGAMAEWDKVWPDDGSELPDATALPPWEYEADSIGVDEVPTKEEFVRAAFVVEEDGFEMPSAAQPNLDDMTPEERDAYEAAVEADGVAKAQAAVDSRWRLDQLRARKMPLWMRYEDQESSDEETVFGSAADSKQIDIKSVIRWPVRDSKGRAYATGKRKTSVARVWIKRGTGEFTVNNKPLAEYFDRASLRATALFPFVLTQTCGAFDVWLTVKGGGISGQAGAIKHGVSKALSRYDPFFRPILKSEKLLRRDPRMVERKKPGQKKARKKFQWVKR